MSNNWVGYDAELVRITLVGTERAKATLRELPKKIQRKVMIKAARAGAAPIRKAVRKFAPRLTGIFRRSITDKYVSYPSGVVVGIVGQRLGDASQLSIRKIRKGRGGISGGGKIVPIHFLEYGTGPHRIPAEGELKTPMRLRAGRGGWQWVSVVNHPGSRPSRPLAQAWESAKSEAQQRFADKLHVEVEFEAEKVRP